MSFSFSTSVFPARFSSSSGDSRFARRRVSAFVAVSGGGTASRTQTVDMRTHGKTRPVANIGKNTKRSTFLNKKSTFRGTNLKCMTAVANQSTPRLSRKISRITTGQTQRSSMPSSGQRCRRSAPWLVSSAGMNRRSSTQPVKMQMKKPPAGSMMLAVTKSSRSKNDFPPSCNHCHAPSDNEAAAPSAMQAPVTIHAAARGSDATPPARRRSAPRAARSWR